MREARNHSEQERNAETIRAAREMSLELKLGLIDDLYRIRRSMHAMYVRCFMPGATDQQVVEHWARLTCEPEIYVSFRMHRIQAGIDALPLPLPEDIRQDTFILRLLEMEPRQVFCEQYHEPIPEVSPV